jgi:hypothetical protein
MTTGQAPKNWRLLVVTNKGQIYHNFPSRFSTTDGTEVAGDIIKFEESVVWDLPERKYPSINSSATGTEKYFPCLPTAAYEYHPTLNTDVSFVDTYGNGGFGKSIIKDTVTYPRFWFPARSLMQNSFFYMGGFEPGDKLSLIGTYRSNEYAGEGSRTCIFATDDGGRQWYCKYEFGGNDIKSNWCNDIDTTNIVNDYIASSFVIKKRTNVIPTETIKEPTDKFVIGDAIEITSITKSKPAVVTTATVHGLSTGNVVSILDNQLSESLSPEWDWMRNDTISTTSGGNGILFKVEVVNSTQFKLHDYIHSAHNNLTARHIHHINRIKDGWIVGTGEVYPDGWQLYMQIKQADTFEVIRAYNTLNIYRLTSTSSSLQRTLGTILLDDADNTVIAASDTSGIPRPNLTLPSGRTNTITRNSSGVYKGKLTDIDDFTKFNVLFEAKEPAYFFKEKGNVLIFCGQRGEFAISFDKGTTWETAQLPDRDPLQYFKSESNGIIIINNYIISILK